MSPGYQCAIVTVGLAPELAAALHDGQRRALDRYGLGHLVHDVGARHAYLVAAADVHGYPVAGLRLQRRTADVPLPLEEAVPLPDSVRAKLDLLEPSGLAELGAFWVDAEVADKHLALRLVRLAVAFSSAAGFEHLVALGGQHSLPLAFRVGFRLDPDAPAFPYPDDRYQSRLVWLSTAGVLHSHSNLPASERTSS